MPLIPNYIARFRTHSQSTAVTASSQSGSASNSTAVPATTAPVSAGPTVAGPSGQIVIKADQIGRKIHPDVSALLNENVAADKAEPPGPRPPKGRSRSVGQLASKKPQGEPLKGMADEDVQKSDLKTHEADIPDALASPRSPFISRILSTPILGGLRSAPATPTADANTEPDSGEPGAHWSTFGRRRLRSSPISELGTLHGRKSGSRASLQSKISRRRAQRGSTPATPSTTRAPSRVPTAVDTQSQSESPAGTVSSSSGSKAYSQHSQSVRSRRPPHAYPEPIPDIEPSSSNDPQTPPAAPFEAAFVPSLTPLTAIGSPRPTMPHLDESPRTFGRVTPKRPGVSSITIPKFDNELQPPRTPIPPPVEHHTLRLNREPPSTYPLRSRKTQSGGWNTIRFPSFPSMPSVHSHVRPRAEEIFQDHEFGRISDKFGVRLGVGSLLSVDGDGPGRRTSAEWSAAEAIKTGDAGEAVTWPAIVSREIVRLSLGGRNGAGSALPVFAGDTEDATQAGEVGRLVESGGKNPTLFGSIGDERRQFLRAGRGPFFPTVAASAPSSLSSTQPPLTESFGQALPLLPADSKSMAADFAPEALGGNFVPHVSVTGPTPIASPSGSRIVSASDPDGGLFSGNLNINDISKNHGKRKKVESDDEAQPETRAILLTRREDSKRSSDASRAPSSFRNSKRIRLSTPSHSPPHDHPSSSHHTPPGSPKSRPPSSLRTLPPTALYPRTLSQSSIPLSAIVSPRPPSIDRRSNYHMRDPALPPPRRQSTQWTGGARKDAEDDRRLFPLQGWAFVVGFLVFPLWWVAAAAPVGWGWGRGRVPMQDGKGMWTEEDLAVREVMEYDVAYAWRQRCRIMSLLGLLVYIPLIVLLAVFVRRRT